MTTTNILVFKSGDEDTYVNRDGKEVCRLTKGMLVSRDQIIYAFTEVKGGDFEENKTKLQSYPAFRTKEQLLEEPAECLYFQSKTLTTLLVSTKLEDSLDSLKANLEINS